MVQEELAGHEEEWEVVKEPAEDEEAAEAIVKHDLSCGSRQISTPGRAKVEGGLLTVVQVLVAALVAKDEETSNADVGEDGERREQPDEGVADEVDLSVILDPATNEERQHSCRVRVGRERASSQVDASAKGRPRVRARIVGVAISQAGVGLPHDALELEELGEEAGATVVDLLGVGGDCEGRKQVSEGKEEAV